MRHPESASSATQAPRRESVARRVWLICAIALSTATPPGSVFAAPARPRARATTARGKTPATSELSPWLRRQLWWLSRVPGGYQGVYVADARGRVLYERRGRLAFNPASNVKLLTAAAALWALGADYRFTTEIRGRQRGSAVVGPLYLRGGGDPRFSIRALRRMVEALLSRGIREVRGPLIVDASLYRIGRSPPGYRAFRSTGPYRAAPSALSLGLNVVGVTIRPAERAGAKAIVSLTPDSPYFRLRARVRTSWGRTRLHVLTFRQGTLHTGVAVSGRIRLAAAPRHYWQRVHHPARFAGHTLRVLLRSAGIALKRRHVRRGRTPSRLPVLARWASQPLSTIARSTLKHSINLQAELLWLALGRAVYGAPGSYAKSRRAMAAFLARLGIPRGRYWLENGSGLSRKSRFRPRDMVRALLAIHQDFAYGPDLLAGLPIVATDGTLRAFGRHSAVAGQMRAKTGTLSGAACLSGVVSHAGHALYFSFMAARIRKVGPVRRRQIRMAAILLQHLVSRPSGR